MPAEPADYDKLSRFQEMILAEQIKVYVKMCGVVRACVTKIFALVWGQCSDGLQAILKASPDYDQKSKLYDAVWLLKECKKILAGVNQYRNTSMLLREKLVKTITVRQFKEETVNQYVTRFKTNLNSLVQVGGEKILNFKVVMNAEWDEVYKKSPSEVKTILAESKDAFAAACLINGAHDVYFGELKRDLENAKNLGRDDYPTTIQAAFELLLNTASIADRNRRFRQRRSNNQQNQQEETDNNMVRFG